MIKRENSAYIFTPSLKASSSSRLHLIFFPFLRNDLFGIGRVIGEGLVLFGLGRCNLFESFADLSVSDCDSIESFHCTDSNHQLLTRHFKNQNSTKICIHTMKV